MALAGTVEHSTPADGTFSAAGALAWDGTSAHTVVLSGEASIAQGGTGLGTLGTALQQLRVNAGETGLEYFTPSAASSTWDTIAAAAGDGSTDNGDWNIVYRVAKTTNSEISFRFTESAAATNGTSTSGVPNQVLLRVDTVAASTMSPLSVYSRATHVFSVSPTTAQILANSGSNTSPVYSFAAQTGMGLYENSNILFIARGGVPKMNFAANISCHVKFYPATDAAATQTATALYGNTGAPNNANGADGDIYFRADGGAGTTIYQRRAGAWVGVA